MVKFGDGRNFEHIADYFNERIACVPLTFLLGFFVSIIVRRWRDTFDNMGWIENLALTLTNLLQGDEMENRQMRRTIIRYTVLSQVLVFRDISMRIRRRFPTMESLVNAGFLNAKELKELNEVDLAYNRYWTPLYWALGVSFKALEKEYFETPWARICVQNEIEAFRTNLAILCNFDWVPIPISYPQVSQYYFFPSIGDRDSIAGMIFTIIEVVFLAVRSYFALCLVSRQFLIKDQGDDHMEVSSLELLSSIGTMAVLSQGGREHFRTTVTTVISFYRLVSPCGAQNGTTFDVKPTFGTINLYNKRLQARLTSNPGRLVTKRFALKD
ncbi:Bestrophin [Cooperia oncophora]